MNISYISFSFYRDIDGNKRIERLDCHCEGFLSIGGFHLIHFVARDTHAGTRIVVKDIAPLAKTYSLNKQDHEAIFQEVETLARDFCDNLRGLSVRQQRNG